MAELSASFDRFTSQKEEVLRRFKANPKAVRKKADWKIRAQNYIKQGMRGINTEDMVTVDPALQRKVIGWIEQVAPTVAAAYNKHLTPVAERAFKYWPVASGLSKSLLALEFAIEGDGSVFVGRIVNRAPYAWFIKSPKSVVQELVFKPGREAARRITVDIGDDLENL